MDNIHTEVKLPCPPKAQPLSLYEQIIAEATGVDDLEIIAMIEGVMRHDVFHSTLDWQSREQLADGARAALALLKADPDPESEGAEAAFANWQVSVHSDGTQWQVCDGGAGDWIADVCSEDHAKRIVVCVNACGDVPDSALASNGATAAQWLVERNTLAGLTASLQAVLELALPFVRQAVEEANTRRDGKVFAAGMNLLRDANAQIEVATATLLATKAPR
jgi:hypothetical protein